jgi:hypothetical protein
VSIVGFRVSTRFGVSVVGFGMDVSFGVSVGFGVSLRFEVSFGFGVSVSFAASAWGSPFHGSTLPHDSRQSPGCGGSVTALTTGVAEGTGLSRDAGGGGAVGGGDAGWQATASHGECDLNKRAIHD